MAQKRGVKGSLMKEFEKRYLSEALNKEKELREKFFSIHSMDTITYELKSKLHKIYKEELSPLQ